MVQRSKRISGIKSEEKESKEFIANLEFTIDIRLSRTEYEMK